MKVELKSNGRPENILFRIIRNDELTYKPWDGYLFRGIIITRSFSTITHTYRVSDLTLDEKRWLFEALNEFYKTTNKISEDHIIWKGRKFGPMSLHYP